ncbi:MAG: ABC transporter ATP-binding protein [Cyclobacteriaceae bacterium]|nr:ABC transporter ATP-binding protein [Cyclobacteriaceae bacterium]
MGIAISNVSKTYSNGVKALDDLSLHIGMGMFGLLGPNGAGKSSLMRTLATLQLPDRGTVFFDSINVLQEPMRLRRTLGYLPQEFGVYPAISAEDLLDYFAILKGVDSRSDRKKRVQEVLELTNLYEVRKKHVAGYSGGMKQRFGIAQLMLNNPQLIIVDEPTAGLDPAERNRFLNVLRELALTATIIFSTHIVDDVKDLCKEMAIMNGGRILQQTTPRNATKELAGKIWAIHISRDELEAIESAWPVLSSTYVDDQKIHVRVHADSKPTEHFQPAEPELADAYFIALKKDA